MEAPDLDHRDIALEDMAADHVRLEADLMQAVADLATYRSIALLGLAGWQAEHHRLFLAEKQIQHLMGIDDESL